MSLKYYFIFFNLLQISFLSSAQTVENLEYHSEGDKVIITYDLVNCNPEERYYISLTFEEQNTSNKLFPESISGDISNLNCGNKKISWDVKKDYNTISGRYYPVLSIKKSIKSVKDIDGNVYKTIQIGTQLWFAENLKTSKYNDGSPLPNITNDKQWENLTKGAWCFYDNDEKYNTKHGKLYNWYAVSPIANGNKNVCPSGWHVPTDTEWTVLIDYLGGMGVDLKGIGVAGNKMEIVGKHPKSETSNVSGFNGIPSGHRDYYFVGMGYNCYWWSSSEYSKNEAWVNTLSCDDGLVFKDNFFKWYGKSIRCIRN
jgi:uncharacterized protein (TIGR02145 family)